MAITYLSGERIQGVSAKPASAWTVVNDGSTVFTATGNQMDFALKRDGESAEAWYDLLGESVADQWVVRFHADFTGQTGTSENYSKTAAFGMYSTTGEFEGTQNAIYLKLTWVSDDTWNFFSISGADLNGDSGNWTYNNEGVDFTAGGDTDLWIELTRNNNTVTAKFYDAAGFGSGDLQDTITYDFTSATGGSGTVAPTGLRYFGIKNRNSSTKTLIQNGLMNEVEFWNSSTTATGDPTVSLLKPSEKATITDVPVGTRFEETDTRKIFRRKAATAVTFESDFTSASGWEQNTSGATNIAVTTGYDRVNYDTTSSGDEDSTLVYDLGTSNISETAWVLRGKSVITNYDAGNSASHHLFCGLSDGGKTVGFDDSQDSISFAIGVGTNDDNYYIGSSNGQAMYGLTNHGHANVGSHVPTEETVYFELIRTSTTGVTLNLFTDTGFSTALSGGGYSVVLGSVPTGFRYLVFKSRDRSISGNECQGYIQDLQFYNGVTAVLGDSWVEKGTA